MHIFPPGAPSRIAFDLLADAEASDTLLAVVFARRSPGAVLAAAADALPYGQYFSLSPELHGDAGVAAELSRQAGGALPVQGVKHCRRAASGGAALQVLDDYADNEEESDDGYDRDWW